MATKQEILSKLAASHEQRISKVLFDLEEDIIAQLQRATDGVPLTTDLAIQLRPNLKRLIEQNYLKEGSKIISEYDEVVKGYMDYIRTTPVSAKFKTLTKPDLVLINQLKQLSFSGFEDVANRFLDTIATEIYSSAVTGKPFPQVVENIRASINGVYRRSNEEAVNRLVRVIEENRYSDDPIAKSKYLNARKILHSKYASDIRGDNMRKYANQIAHDSIMQFDGQFTKHKGQEAGINTYKYTGTNITTTRQFCRAYLNEIKTEEEWREIFTGNWRGKSGSDPFVNRGGYRCRHSLIPYDPAWDVEDVQKEIKKKQENTEKTSNIFGKVSKDEKELLKKAYGNKTSAITKAIAVIPPLKKLKIEKGTAFYRSSEDLITIEKADMVDDIMETFVHEYGHRIDYEMVKYYTSKKSINKFNRIKEKKNAPFADKNTQLSNYAAEKVLEDRKAISSGFRKRLDGFYSDLDKTADLAASQISAEKRVEIYRDATNKILAKKGFPLTREEVAAYLGKTPEGLDGRIAYKFVLQIDNKLVVKNTFGTTFKTDFADYVGGITREKTGYGHGVSYYQNRRVIYRDSKNVVMQGEPSEAFANYNTLIRGDLANINRKLMSWYAPNTTAEFDFYFEEFNKL
jgi:uncharacterized protein with gpF-like domain